jgi:hypothetical protein
MSGETPTVLFLADLIAEEIRKSIGEHSVDARYAFVVNTYDETEIDKITSTVMVTTAELLEILNEAHACGTPISVFELGNCVLAWRDRKEPNGRTNA